MKHKLTLICIGLIGLCTLSSFRTGDNDPIATLLKKLSEYTKKYPQEKVHLHLDKPYYAVGDDIWFKAYIVDSRSSELSLISGFLYVELIDEAGQIQAQLKTKVTSGTAQGDFKLEGLSEGNYRIRAYTQYMRNAGPDFFFDKTIKVGNLWTNEVFVSSTKPNGIISFTDKNGKPFSGNNVSYEIEAANKKIASGNLPTNNKGEIQVPLTNPQLAAHSSARIKTTITLANKDKVVKYIPIRLRETATAVQFFAEGGNLVAGLPNRLAIKAINANGLGEKVSGKLIDNNNTEIATFETSALGMGSVFFTPTAGKTYTAQLKLANGTERQAKLPQVEKNGYVLSINNADSSKMAIKVSISPELLNKGELTLIGQHNGEVYFSSKVQGSKPFTSMVVNKTDFVSGILQLTLFDPNNMPVCERLAFINNPNDKIGLKMEGLKPSYAKRENLALDITATNDGTPLVGTFSVAVTNSSVVVPDLENETNIFTSLLLTGDLVGYIEKPNRYFLNNTDQTRTELDNLMLTQGWRKINWKAIAGDVPPTTVFEPEVELKVSGTVKTLQNKPVPNAKVNLFSNTKVVFTKDTLSDGDGFFSFRRLNFADSTSFLANAFDAKGNNNLKITFDTIAAQPVTKNRNMPDIKTDVNVSLRDYLNNSNPYFEELVKEGRLKDAIQLKQIEIEKKRDVKAAGFIREGRADITKVIDKNEMPMSLTDYIPRIPGLYEVSGLIYTRAHGSAGAAIGRGSLPMLVIVDGITQDSFRTSMYMTSDIEKIEVLTSASNTTIYGSRAGAGVIQITLRKGPSGFGSGNSNIKGFTPKGYFVEREFYAPRYDVDKNNNTIDLRTTVYWNPNIMSDKEGKLKLNYFNTDQPGNYRIVIEGIDDLGNLARKIYEYKVN